MLRLTFACGHSSEVRNTNGPVPVCDCGERRIEHVQTDPPRIAGCASGPHVETKDLAPLPVALGNTLKES